MGEHDIYMSRLEGQTYTTPQNLGPAINSSLMEHDPLISPDEKLLIFTGLGRSDSYGEADLYYSRRSEGGQWSVAKNLGGRLNTITYEYCPNYSPDMKYFFYSSEYDVKWVDVEVLLEFAQ